VKISCVVELQLIWQVLFERTILDVNFELGTFNSNFYILFGNSNYTNLIFFSIQNNRKVTWYIWHKKMLLIRSSYILVF
jgi:hypothetical protein